MKSTINSQESLSVLIGDLRELWKTVKYFQVSVTTGKGRSAQQNSISHAWYQQISQEERQYTPTEVKNRCKFHIGLPILRGEVDLSGKPTEQAEKYNLLCDDILIHLTYEQKIAAMELLPVTSVMKVKQLSEYLGQVQSHYVGRVKLEFPDER